MSESKSERNGIFAQRLVIADFYMEKPISGFDPCYSEFRGKEIKRVPIIRIFGSRDDGRKTCMHVHGVFPYFYIPYEAKEFESLNKALYQISSSVDKAINISLGQACSSAQHVFKVQLVKGIPFYGYHPNEHQFLKIYMFNPRFVRRAANLLQSGAVMNKNFHPYESHVPYILQFMIDYNLYGMSFLYVPLEIVKFRQASSDNNFEHINFPDAKKPQILNPSVAQKQSICAIEVDISSSFILNRYQLKMRTNNSNTYSNPGIEAIWKDERSRRQNMAEKLERENVPALEVPVSQARPNAQIAESEIFHKTVLQSKLSALDSSASVNSSQTDKCLSFSLQKSDINLTLNDVSNKDQKSTFNLRKIIGNAIYPEEVPSNENLVDASFVENHVSHSNFLHTDLSEIFVENPHVRTESTIRGDSIFSEDTIIDEELLLNLPTNSPKRLNASLCTEDMELLDVLQQLEEHEESENHIDLDSTLAPLTQTHKKFDTSPELLDKQGVAAVISQLLPDSGTESDTSENGNLHDFSIALEDMDEFILKFTSSQPTQEQNLKEDLPQIDGSDDFVPKTPIKSRRNPKASNNRNGVFSPRSPRTLNGTNVSPKRSPRTPQSSASKKYAPLPLKITCKKSESKTEGNDTTPVRHSVLRNLDLGSCNPKSPKMTLSKKLGITSLRRKSVDWSTYTTREEFSKTNEVTDETNTKRSTPIRRSRRTIDLDKTHITCELTPRRKTERILKVYSIEENKAKEIQSHSYEMMGKDAEVCRSRNSDVGISKKTAERYDNSSPDLKIQRSKQLEQHNIKKCVVKIRNIVYKESDDSVKKPRGIEIITDVWQQPVNSTSIPGSVQYIANESNADLRQVNAHENPQSNLNESDEIAASDTEDAATSIGAKRLRRSFHLVQHKRMLRNDVISSNDSHVPIQRNVSASRGVSSPAEDVENEEDYADTEDLHIQSFYDVSFTEDLNSPINCSELFSPTLDTAKQNISSMQIFRAEHNNSLECHQTHGLNSVSKQKIITNAIKTSPLLSESTYPLSSSPSKHLVQITPAYMPPTYDDVLASCEKFDIPEYEFQRPFYGIPDDVTQLKEVGHITLHIPGNKLNDCDEFKSVLGDELNGIAEWRRQLLLAFSGPSALTAPSHHNTQRIREYFAESSKVLITPQICPPTLYDAKLWLKARTLVSNDEKYTQQRESLEESPIKVKRQKIAMILDNGMARDDDEDVLDKTNCITLTPATPAVDGEKSMKLRVSAKIENYRDNAAESSKRHRKRAKLSLNAKLMASASPEMSTSSEDGGHLAASQIENGVLSFNGVQLVSSNDSTISSQTVLDALKRKSFLKELQSNPTPPSNEISFGLSTASLDNTFGFKVNLENLQEAKSDVEYNYITTIILELFVPTRGNLLPDPALDEVRCLFYIIEHRSPATQAKDASQTPQNICGSIIVKDGDSELDSRMLGTGGNNEIAMRFVHTEIEAFEALVELCVHWDPDIFGGYEIETASWGYILERSKHLGFNIAPQLSRVPTQKVREYVDEDREHFTDLDIEMKLCGRILLDVWRLMRSEIALTSYTFENVMYHILHRRCPAHNHRALTDWFEVAYTRWIVIEYYVERVRGTLALLEQLDLIGRTSEMAKLIGIQFYEVLSRGSQFRVESMMLRIAKPRNLVPLSPSVQQRAHMRAPEYLPLILEPQSRFYADPVIVLDFQSLYPSMIIAYNYCFSTCLGRVEHLGHSTPFEFGASQLRVSPYLLRRLINDDLINISPCGVVFVKSTVREGILPRMLSEILNTRQMVKQSMKLDKTNSALQRILHSRQLGLKLMANVTYGYTAANFSGRMPAVEVGDSVVAKGRETLERAIRMVESNEKWRVRVVYGDTDSLFVQVPGRNREQAFKIGAEIAEAVSKDNPQPVKLKLEKVYQPCILQTKKRYVGYMYETADQTEPVYEAKGIETVRRDGCPAVAKMLEKVLRILFETADVSQVKHYVCRQFSKLLAGRANLQDLIYAKEFRGLNGYKPTACVPALELTRRWLQTDPRRVPRCGERVPFIIINGPPGVPLIRLVRSPHEVLNDEGLKINAIYYITKAIIPPLNRCLLLIGADVNEWFANLPRKLLPAPIGAAANKLTISGVASSTHSKKSTISQYFSVTNCIIDCGRQTKQGICEECVQRPQRTFVTLHDKMAKIERGYQLIQQICQACCGRVGAINCSSLDCPVLFVSEVKKRDLQQIEHMRSRLVERF